MDQYVTGTIIRKLREEKKMTQAGLADKLCVSEKTISKWETGKGYPDITMLEDIAAALDISVIELLSGNDVTNRNRAFNMRRSKFYVCPVCGNVLFSSGEAVISCCGVVLPALEAEEIQSTLTTDEKATPLCDKNSDTKNNSYVNQDHNINVEIVEDEYFISISHEMTKRHSISFIAAIKDNGVEIVKLYPEGNAEARFKISRTKDIYFYCNRHGLFHTRVMKRANHRA